MPHYVRRHRLRAALTQKEMAFLLGCRSPATVCQYEARKREPDLRTALAYQAAFNVPVENLFPGIRQEVEQAVRLRAKDLSKQIISSSPTASHKRDAMRSILATPDAEALNTPTV